MIPDEFYSGYQWGISHNSTVLGGQIGSSYYDEVAQEISRFLSTLDRRNIKTASDKYQGNMQEFGLAGRFNIQAKAAGSHYRAEVLESTEFASVDIRIYKIDNLGKEIPNSSINYSLKSYKDAAKSGRVQATTIWEAYKEYIRDHKAKGVTEDNYSYQQFCKDRKVDPELARSSDLIYQGDFLLVAKGKLTGAKAAIQRKINQTTDPEIIQSRKEALSMLDDHIETPDEDICVFMWPRAKAEKFTKLAKKGKLDLEKLGLRLDDIYTEKRIWTSAIKSGKYAFFITFACKIAPLIASSIWDLITQGYIDVNEFADGTLKESTESFIQGTISSYLTTKTSVELMKHGLGIEIPPELIAMVVALTLDVIVTSIRGYINGLSRKEITTRCLESSAIMLFAFAGMKAGALLGAKIGGAAFSVTGPLAIIPSIIGSFIGATVGCLTIKTLKNSCISLCIKNGYTFFGLVEQDYTLPEELTDILHLDPISADPIPFDSIPNDQLSFDSITFDHIQSDSLLDIILTRGYIEGNRIGYLVS